MSPKGFLCLVLHGHLPFVRHSEIPECLEEDWFFEALTEVYLPLLEMFRRLEADGVGFKMAMGLSPTLIAMMTDPLLESRYEIYLDRLVGLSESECRRTAGDPQFAPLAKLYHQRFLRIREFWNQIIHRDLLGVFLDLSRSGRLELMTTAATHGFLPLMEVCPAALRAQIQVGCQSFEKAFGNRPAGSNRPAGFWLPECGFAPSVDSVLSDAGIRYTFLETHGILHGTPRPRFGVYAPVRSPSGLVLFGRDPETARQVWSAAEGYPGDFQYREFYRDIGFDLPEQYLKPFRVHGGLRTATGIKYFRITGRTDAKEPYQPEAALAKAREHAGNFLFNRERQAEHLYRIMNQPAVVTAMYDAELFGHWWFEGPAWLEHLFREFDANRSVVQLKTPGEILARAERIQTVTPHLSTWGWKGYNEMWLQGTNAWIYPHLHRAAWRMNELVSGNPVASGITRRALNQALRELFLAQSSDWAFILAQRTASGYAQSRLQKHLGIFARLYEQIRSGNIDSAGLTEIEGQDNLFPFLDYRVYR
ncbi:MAG: DUF1957 domain-containing protein [Candidatus Omnitrophica bacterium]|nr:DUF1957 domain-containing protein [Candidatus Omnitrophota bacterium]